MTLKRYSITVRGFDAHHYVAETASKARYQCFKAWREAGYGRTYPGQTKFRDFLERVETTLHLGRPA